MPEIKYISREEAAQILNVAPRTVRRYIKLKKLVPTYVQGKFGQELRLREDEVRSLTRGMAKGSEGVDRLGHEPMATNGHGALSLDPLVLWDAYEALQTDHRNLAAQLGFLSAKADEVKLLTDRAESLQKEKQEIAQQLEAMEQVKSQLEGETTQKDELNKALQQEKTELHETLTTKDTLIKNYQAQLRRQVWTSLAIIILALFAGVVVSSAIAGNLSGVMTSR